MTAMSGVAKSTTPAPAKWPGLNDGAAVCRYLGVELTNWQVWAIDYLERRGLQFAVDFGHENAEAIAERYHPNWWNQ
jgi:hypothetical protein